MPIDPDFWLNAAARHWLTISYVAMWVAGIFIVGHLTDRRS